MSNRVDFALRVSKGSDHVRQHRRALSIDNPRFTLRGTSSRSRTCVDLVCREQGCMSFEEKTFDEDTV